MTTLMVWRLLHIFMSFSLQGPHLDTFPKIHSIFLILLSLLPMTLNIHCALSSIQKWCLRLTENFLLQSQLPSSSNFSTDSLTDPALLTSRDTVSCWEGDSTLKSRPVFWWFTIIQVLPPIYSLCSRKLAGVNGAFPSLPLSFGTRRSCWSGGSLNSKSKEFCVLQQPWYSPIQRDLPLPPTNLTSLESFDRCLAYPLTRLKAAQASGRLLSYDDPEPSHCLGNCFRDGGKKALARSKREDAAGGLLTEQSA